MIDPYSIFGVSRNASADEIKKAYRQLAQSHHPDKKGGSEEKFKEISEAYDILKDPQKKDMFDKYGSVNPHQHSNPFSGGGWDFNVNINDFFGKQHRRTNTIRRNGVDLKIILELPLRDIYTGTNKRVQLKKPTNCTNCGGAGGHELTACGICNGTGQIHKQMGMMIAAIPCPHCNSSGVKFSKPCGTCHTSGTVNQTREYEINIPAGIEEGVRLNLQGQGGEGFNAPNGNLFVYVNIKKETKFWREGRDLHTEIDVKYTDIYFGASILINVMGVKQLNMNIPPKTISTNRFSLDGHGFPEPRSQASKGKLLVHLNVVHPEFTTPEQEKEFNDVLKKMI